VTHRDGGGQVGASDIGLAGWGIVVEPAWTEDDPLERGALDEDLFGLVLPLVPCGDRLAHTQGDLLVFLGLRRVAGLGGEPTGAETYIVVRESVFVADVEAGDED
jgi:hypothetical protein